MHLVFLLSGTPVFPLVLPADPIAVVPHYYTSGRCDFFSHFPHGSCHYARINGSLEVTVREIKLTTAPTGAVYWPCGTAAHYHPVK